VASAPKPVTSKMEDRFVELVGKQLSYAEASRAVEIGASTGDRIAKARRQDIDALRNGGGDDASAATREVVRAMFEATLPDGTPDERTRRQAAALRLRYAQAFEKLEEDAAFSDDLPAGAVLYPQPYYDLTDDELREQYPDEYERRLREHSPNWVT